MPRFFFDTDDGHTYVRDEEGCEVEDRKASRRLALETLTDIAGERLPTGEYRICKIAVRDAAGRMIYHAQVGLIGEWLV
jgi:hypothetical protein